jgi:Homing endonuclease associated repeat
LAPANRDDIVRRAREIFEKGGRRQLTRDEFERQTGVSDDRIYRLFPEGGWSEVKRLAGIDLRPKRDYTREEVIALAKRLASEGPDLPLSKLRFEQQSGVSEHFIYRLFPEGGWSELRRAAGIAAHPEHPDRLGNDELLEEYYKVATALGRIPSWATFSAKSKVSGQTLARRFGKKEGLRSRFREYLVIHHRDSPLLNLQELSAAGPHPVRGEKELAQSNSTRAWNRTESVEFGAPINFRGLQHAPVNEQGVVFLFGLVSRDLGFLVESVRTSYPDCEGKRCVDPKRDRWQRVRIEFEFYSSNFKDHGHDPAGCDVVVCWEDDWAGCPVEVVELRSEISRFPK